MSVRSTPWRVGFALIGFALIGFALAACGRTGEPPRSGPESASPDARAPARSEPARAPASFVGVLISAEVAEVAAEVRGRLETTRVSLGDCVDEGAIVATVDTKVQARDLPIAEAGAAGAEAELEERRVRLRDAEERRARSLAVADFVTREEVRGAAVQVDLSAAELRRSESQTRERRAELERLRASIRSGDVRAPFSGCVGVLYRRTGAWVEPGTPLLRLIGRGAPRVRFAVDGPRATQLRGGERLLVDIDDAALTGAVADISPEVDLASGLVLVEGTIDPAGAQVKHGLVVRVRFADERPGSR